MLALTNLSSGYGEIPVLRGLSLEVREQEIVCILGANGAGKSTLLKSISRVLPWKSGRMLFQGQDLSKATTAATVRSGIVHVPEGRQVFPTMTVAENLELGAYLQDRRDAAKYRRQMDFVFSLFPRLRERIHQLAGTLSGGEQQMLAIGRGLMAFPRLLLLDEPSLGVAPNISKQILSVVRELPREGCSTILVEQNARLALGVSDRAYVMRNGAIVDSGTAESLSERVDLRTSYLGEAVSHG